MKVLVTGSEGYIGKPLCAALRVAGHDVEGLDLKTGWDATKDDLPLDGVDTVIPLAAVVGAPACAKDPARAREVIVGSAQRLAERLDGRGCFYLTTDSGYPPGSDIATDTPLYPQSTYAKLKHEAAEILRGEGAAVLRLASLFGESPSMRDDLLAHWMIRETLQRRALPVLTGAKTRRAFVHIDDVVEGVVTATGNWRRGAFLGAGVAYSLASHDRLTKRDLAVHVALACDVSPSFVEEDFSDSDGRDFWLTGSFGYCGRRLDAEIPKLVAYYLDRDSRVMK